MEITAANMLRLACVYALMASQKPSQRAENDYLKYEGFLKKVRPYLKSLRDLTVLDIGCGRLFPLTLLLHSRGIRVIGIDTAYIGIGQWFVKRWWYSWKSGGMRALAREALYDLSGKTKTYYRVL